MTCNQVLHEYAKDGSILSNFKIFVLFYRNERLIWTCQLTDRFSYPRLPSGGSYPQEHINPECACVRTSPIGGDQWPTNYWSIWYQSVPNGYQCSSVATNMVTKGRLSCQGKISERTHWCIWYRMRSEIFLRQPMRPLVSNGGHWWPLVPIDTKHTNGSVVIGHHWCRSAPMATDVGRRWENLNARIDRYHWSPIGRRWQPMVTIRDQWPSQLPKEDLRSHALSIQKIINFGCAYFHQRFRDFRQSIWQNMKWATAWQNQQNDMFAKRRLRTTWASARPSRSESSLQRSFGKLRDQGYFMQKAKTLIRLGGCPGWSESSLGAHVIVLILSCCGSNIISGR